MKKFLSKKSRKLILSLLLGFRNIIIMEIFFISIFIMNDTNRETSTINNINIYSNNNGFAVAAASLSSPSSLSSSASSLLSLNMMTTIQPSSTPSILLLKSAPFLILHRNITNITTTFQNENIRKKKSKLLTFITTQYEKYNNRTFNKKIYNKNDKNPNNIYLNINDTHHNLKISNVNFQLRSSVQKMKNSLKKYEKNQNSNSSYKHMKTHYIKRRNIDYLRDLKRKSASIKVKREGEYEEQEPIVIAMKHENDGDVNVIDNKNFKSIKNQKYFMNSEAGLIPIDRYNKIDNNVEDDLNDNEYNLTDDDYDDESVDYNSPYGVATTPNIINSNSKDSDRNYDLYDENDDDDETSERDFKDNNSMSYLVTAKNLWDIFIAVSNAWNVIANQQKQQRSLNETQNFNNNNNNSNKISSSTSFIENQKNLNYSNDYDERLRRDSFYLENEEFPRNLNEPPYKSFIDHQQMSELNPQTATKSTTEISVASGRYIKGDPLKGYYDFVITEGSYKFWAAFQLATAILIIYSTFAAIYYSKVNPLVGDYDYVDYLGGARSLSMSSNDNNIDFVDYDTANDMSYDSDFKINLKSNITKSKRTSSWSSILNGDWMPVTGHTIKFILDAIDKIPSSQ